MHAVAKESSRSLLHNNNVNGGGEEIRGLHSEFCNLHHGILFGQEDFVLGRTVSESNNAGNGKVGAKTIVVEKNLYRVRSLLQGLARPALSFRY